MIYGSSALSKYRLHIWKFSIHILLKSSLKDVEHNLDGMWNKCSSVQSLSHVWLFVTPWNEACKSSLSITNSHSLLKLMSIESVRPSNHLTLCYPFLLLPSIFQPFNPSTPASGSFPMSQFLASGGQSIGASASASVLLMDIQDWFPLRLTWSPCNPRDSQESSPTPQFKSSNSLVLSFLYGPILTATQLGYGPTLTSIQLSN